MLRACAQRKKVVSAHYLRLVRSLASLYYDGERSSCGCLGLSFRDLPRSGLLRVVASRFGGLGLLDRELLSWEREAILSSLEPFYIFNY